MVKPRFKKSRNNPPPLKQPHADEVDDPWNYPLVDPSADNQHASGRHAAPAQKSSSKVEIVKDKWYYLTIIPIILGLTWLSKYCDDYYDNHLFPAAFGEWFPAILSVVSFFVALFLWKMDFFGLI